VTQSLCAVATHNNTTHTQHHTTPNAPTPQHTNTPTPHTPHPSHPLTTHLPHTPHTPLPTLTLKLPCFPDPFPVPKLTLTFTVSPLTKKFVCSNSVPSNDMWFIRKPIEFGNFLWAVSKIGTVSGVHDAQRQKVFFQFSSRRWCFRQCRVGLMQIGSFDRVILTD